MGPASSCNLLLSVIVSHEVGNTTDFWCAMQITRAGPLRPQRASGPARPGPPIGPGRQSPPSAPSQAGPPRQQRQPGSQDATGSVDEVFPTKLLDEAAERQALPRTVPRRSGPGIGAPGRSSQPPGGFTQAPGRGAPWGRGGDSNTGGRGSGGRGPGGMGGPGRGPGRGPGGRSQGGRGPSGVSPGGRGMGGRGTGRGNFKSQNDSYSDMVVNDMIPCVPVTK